MRLNIFIAGVGGQGIISLSRIIGETALCKGMNVLIAETHGMAQRGGSVAVSIRIGNVYSSRIGRGSADILVGLEPLEAARYADMLSDDAIAVVNTHPIIPYSVSARKTGYPPVKSLLSQIRRNCSTVVALNAFEISERVGFPLAANSAILGAIAASGKIDAKPKDFKKAIKGVIRRRINENLESFDLGYRMALGKIGDA